MSKATTKKRAVRKPSPHHNGNGNGNGSIGSGDKGQRFNIRGYAEIPVEDIEAHPLNPRPTFHLSDDDPGLKALGESLKVDGQHRPAVVYELVGHYDPEVPDQPGKYRLYQGERRWRSARIAEVENLRCFIVDAPKSEAEEWEWLGVEEAFKQDWQPFFVLKYCNNLAEQHSVPVYSSEISAKTGVPMSDLKIAEKLFKLEEPIQFFAAEYEELMYDQLVKGKRKRGTRLSGTGVRSKEFPVNKAAMVYDIFEAMREHTPLLVKKYSDLELQQLIAQKATQGATLEELQKLHGQIKQLGKNPPPGLLTEISELLENDNRTIRGVLKNAGVEESGKLNQFMQRSVKVRKLCASITEVIDNVGNDPDDLRDVQVEALALFRDASELERAVSRRIDELVKERR